MQRMQEQEREMQIRQEQQKQQYQTMIPGPPGVYHPPQVPYLPAPGYPVQQSADGSPGHVQYPGQYGQPPMGPGPGQQPVYPPYNIQSMPGSQVHHPYSAPPVLPTPAPVSQPVPPTCLGSLPAGVRGPPNHQVVQVVQPMHVPSPATNHTMPQQLQGVSTASVMGTHQMVLPTEQPAEAELISFD
ncbi:hepatocyte growth factor-regulated tyrosine kinase substrate-like isoform X2 [Limulus polyphemus]|nr:hepatocyte growth factor-regulated tyrosine kinase substrate-like isoform X2 [Limulus polyphemus]